MNLYTINTGYLKLDGGSMFGIVPKTLWNSLNPADVNNRCTWAARCLLVENEDRLILIDTGVGNKGDTKFNSIFEPHGNDSLAGSLDGLGFIPSDITDVLLTHLHFDHCGGAVNRSENGSLEIAFPNAHFWTCTDHLNWASDPNPREKASFLKDNILPLRESGQLKFTDRESMGIPGLEVEYVYGHTEAMMVVHIDDYKGRPLSYGADLIPSSHHVRMPYIMAYDLRPLETLKEKARFLEQIASKNGILMFEHDKDIECCSLEKTERGIFVGETFSLSEV
jgi:glyoxylase-like metal-dependent hydrolase (beta-lactamase superfamily II)